MSPALIDIKTPSKPSFLPQNPNPSNPISSSLLFDISSNTFGVTKSMKSSTRNSNEGGFESVFREEPRLRSVSGRSLPRLVKLRKHAASNRGRSRSIAESEIPSDFNPFCEGSVRVDDDSRFQELYEKYQTQNNNSGSSISEDFELGKSDDSSSFVFGVNLNSVRNSDYEKSGFDGSSKTSSLPDEMMNLNIGSESSKDKKNVFVFGSSKKESSLDGSAASKLQDELTKLNLGSFGNVDGVEKTEVDKAGNSVFGRSRGVASAFDTNVDSKLPYQMQSLNIKDTGNGNVGDAEKMNGGKFKSNSFVFGNSRNGASSLGGVTTSVLPNEMKKLNIDDSKVGANFEEPKDDHFKVDKKNVFVFGSNKSDSGSFRSSTINMLPEEMSKLNMGSEIGNPSTFPDTASSSSFNAESKVSTDNVFNDPGVSNSRCGSFSFQATKPSTSSSVGSDHSVQPNDDSKSSGASTSSYTFYTAGLGFQSSGNVSEGSTVDRHENKAEFAFGTPASCSSTASSFTCLNQKLEFSAKNGAVKDTNLKKKRGKTKQPAAVHRSGQYNVSSENSFQENAESPGCYSPMDVSPHRETFAADKSSRDTSVTSDEYIQLHTDRPAADTYSSVSVDAIDEDFVTATESLDINEDYAKCEESKEGSMDNFENDFHVDNEYLRSKTEANVKNDASVSAIERDTGFHSHVESKGNDGKMEFCFTTNCENVSGPNFTFAASTSAQGHTSAAKRHYKKKTRLKSGQDSYNSTLTTKLQFTSPDTSFFPLPGHSSDPVTELNRKGDSSLSQFMGENRAETNKEAKVKEGSISVAAATAVAHEACEKWRLRGNKAYDDGNLSKAEDYYTRGLNCVPRNETSEGCLTALTLCYSNRAAARMSSGRMRAALEDCKRAAEINPDFRKVKVRAGNCHLALGEIEDALQYFKNSLPPGADLCLDRKLVIEASNGLQKAQKAGEYLNRCSELLRRRTSSDAESALQIIAEALLVCPFSEKLIELKAEALLMLRKYEETIQLCEQSLDSADKNSSSVSADGSESIKICPARLWRWGLMTKSYFYLGRLEEALTLLEKLEQAEPFTQKFGNKTPELTSTLAVTVRELLRHKAAGNEAFQSGRHLEAVEHYTSALSCNLESRPFAAICFCNRAAAHQALGQITEAIADCSLAIALDGNYLKAISRIATLHEMIRDYSQAAIHLQRLVSLLEKPTGEKSNPSGRLGRSTSGIIDLRQAHSRLSTMEEEAKKGIPLDMYLILGIESSSVGTDIKKAYRRAALRHHPDKAAQVLPRSENGDDGVWREIGEAVYKDADRLFKMIGEAYAALSDPVKRFQYDEEETRYTKKGNGSTSRTSSDVHNSPFERSGGGRQWQDEVRRSYRHQYSHWSEASRSSRYF